MQPDRKSNGFADIGLQRRLRKQSGNETCQHVAAAALSKMGIAGRIHKNFARAPTYQRLVSFQHDPTIAKAARNFPHRLWTVRLHLLAVLPNIRAASPGCGVTTRISFLDSVWRQASPVRLHLQSWAIADRATIVDVGVFNSSTDSGAAIPGPIKTALADSGNFVSGFQILTITARNCDATT